MPKREPITILVVAVAVVCALALPLGIAKAALGIASGGATLAPMASESAPPIRTIKPAAVRNRAVSADSRSGARQGIDVGAQEQKRPQKKKVAAAAAIPLAPGMERSCPMTHRFPARSSSGEIVAKVAKTWGVQLKGASWKKKANRPVLKVMWQTLDAVDCTPFVKSVKAKNDGKLIISGEKAGSWAWGDYGFSDPDGVSLSLDKMAVGVADGQSPRVVRVMVHEMAHAWSADREEGSGYFARFAKIGGSAGALTEYGSQNTSENFAEAAGYYVARCAKEQSDTGKPKRNPYDDDASAAYYAFVGKTLFGGKKFGPSPGSSC